MPSATTELIAIYPLEEAIRRRLEAKRRQREEAARREAERIAEIERQEQLVARLMVDWLAQNEGVEVNPDELRALLCHNDGYRIVWQQGDAYVELLAHVTLHEDPDRAWIEVDESDRLQWKGICSANGHKTYVECDRFVDAVIYALGLKEV